MIDPLPKERAPDSQLTGAHFTGNFQIVGHSHGTLGEPLIDA